MYKKYFSIILLAVCFALVFSSCAKVETINAVKDLEGKTLAAVSSTLADAEYQKAIEESTGANLKEIKFFDSSLMALAALKANQVDAVIPPSFTAEAYVKNDASLKALPLEGNVADSFCVSMVLRAADVELQSKLNMAINDIRSDGTLDGLKFRYVDEPADYTKEKGADFPVIKDAPTIKIGVSGDVNPLDYIAADGRAAGYCVEVLSAISKKIGFNFEIVPVTAQAKYVALESGKIDIFFHELMPTERDEFLKEMKILNDKIGFTDPFFWFDGFSVVVKK